jgi:SWI/SNF-related matrix-associated actin-dependent regulator of chromatin subfamily A3
LSGTPIQNKLTDLASILEFLKAYPFSNPKYFESEILQPWHRGDQQGVLRLKRLVNLITLCRTKAVVDLPKRIDQIHHLDFSLAEHKAYESAKSRTTEMLKEAVSIDYTKRVTYLNALQWLNNLRLICNHGVIQHSQCKNTKSESDSSWNLQTAQKAFENMLYAGAAICVGCTNNLVEATYEDAALNMIDLPQPRLSECLFLICGSCISRSSPYLGFSGCSHSPKHPTFTVSLTISSESYRTEDACQIMTQTEMPTKIRALLESLQRCEKGEKRYQTMFLM